MSDAEQEPSLLAQIFDTLWVKIVVGVIFAGFLLYALVAVTMARWEVRDALEKAYESRRQADMDRDGLRVLATQGLKDRERIFERLGQIEARLIEAEKKLDRPDPPR